jgi:hypothetical protein
LVIFSWRKSVVLSISKPIEIRIIENYIEDWKEFDDGFLIFPKKDIYFNKLFMRSRRIFMDKVFEFSALIEIVPSERMEERFKNLFYSLIGLSCELRWDGIILKKPRFESYRALKMLQTYLPTLEVNEKLANALNNSYPIMRALRIIHPDDLFITLTSLSSPQNFEFQGYKNMMETLARSFLKPSDITWIINMNKLISRTLRYRRIFEETIKLINLISEIILRTTNVYFTEGEGGNLK